jgi:hypothetical protein
MPPCSLVDGYQRSRGNMFPLSGSTPHTSYTLTTAETNSSETSVSIYQTKRRFVPQRHNPKFHSRDNLNSHTFVHYGHFPLSLQTSARKVSQIGHDRVLPNPFHFIINQPMIQRYIIWDTHCTQSPNNPRPRNWRKWSKNLISTIRLNHTFQWGQFSEL